MTPAATDPAFTALAGDPIRRLLGPADAAGDADGGGDELVLWWLGQAGFALRLGDQLIVIDPYLSDSLARRHRGEALSYARLEPVPVDPELLREVTWLLCTHGHGDHMDPDTIPAIERAASPHVVVPRSQLDRAIDRGAAPARLHPLDAGERLSLTDAITVTAIPAAHEELTLDADGSHLFLGYVLDLAGVRVYHSGDCVDYPGLAEALRDAAVQLALLPVNGRDAWRRTHGAPGNFTVAEAADLCRRAGIEHCVAHHVGMFASNPPDGPAVERAIAEAGPLRRLRVGTAYRVALAGSGGAR